MNFINTITTRALGFVAALSLATWAQATPLQMFETQFEGDLTAWTEREPGNSSGQIVGDPAGAGHGQVLGFQRTGSSGTLFSTEAVTSNSGKFLLTFDYLGRWNELGTIGDLGGYIGVAPSIDGGGMWVGGTGSHPTPINLIDDGEWHSYSFNINSEWGLSLRVVLEDWDGSGNTVGDAFFDNISLQAVPEPTSLALVGLALVAVGATGKRRAAVKA